MLDRVVDAMRPHPRGRLRALAVANGGPFTTSQARHAGYSAGEIQHLKRSGRWIALRRGVYVDRDFFTEFHSKESAAASRRHFLDAAAAVLSAGDAVVSHESAICLFGLGVLGVPATVTLTRPASLSRRSRLEGVKVHAARVPAGHRYVCLGVPVTSPARTVADLARTLPYRNAVTVADAALHARLTNTGDLHGVLADCMNWPGTARAREVAVFADGKAESALESIARVVFAEQGLPAPQMQVRIVIRAGLAFRADFVWERFRTIAEADGLLKYSDPSALRDEKLRQEALADRGYEVVRFTWKQLHEDPAGVAARIRRGFARGARHPAARGRPQKTVD